MAPLPDPVVRLAPWLLIALAAPPLAACGAAGFGDVQRPDGGSGLLPVGAPAPDVPLLDQDGKERKLSDHRGRPVVVYFYPKDGSPGCTQEACAFRDAWLKLQIAGADVFGVSNDDVASHKKFHSEHKLPFSLLADSEGKLAAAFGVRVTLNTFERVTFLLNGTGRVARVFPDVDPAVHADEVAREAQAIRDQSPRR